MLARISLSPHARWPLFSAVLKIAASLLLLCGAARASDMATVEQRIIAGAYNNPASIHYLSTNLLEKYMLAFDGWVTADPTDPNWWWPDIAFPKALGEAMILMKSSFTPARLTSGTTLIARSYRPRSDINAQNTGANRTDPSYASPQRASSFINALSDTIPLAGTYRAAELTSALARLRADRDSVADGLAWLLTAASHTAASHTAPAAALLPSVAVHNGDLRTTFTLLAPDDRGLAVVKLQYSPDLVTWTTVPVPATTGTQGGIDFVIPPVGEVLDVQVTLPAVLTGSNARVFLRLRGELPTP